MFDLQASLKKSYSRFTDLFRKNRIGSCPRWYFKAIACSYISTNKVTDLYQELCRKCNTPNTDKQPKKRRYAELNGCK
jgi:hypothetical protein